MKYKLNKLSTFEQTEVQGYQLQQIFEFSQLVVLSLCYKKLRTQKSPKNKLRKPKKICWSLLQTLKFAQIIFSV